MFDRREFLRRGAALGLAPALLPWAGRAAAEASGSRSPEVRRRVPLGRTGLQVPDIGFGSSALAGDEALVQHALERGITYFDTAPGYRGGASEETLGRALAGRRDEVVITTKTMARADARREELFEALEASLRRLRTERVDVYLNHAVNALDRLENPEWPEFVSRAKEQGKLRFSGMSGHGGRLVECLEAALDAELAEVVLVAHNFGQDAAFYERFTRSFDTVATQPGLGPLMQRAREAGVGVVAMKTLRGARLNDMRPYEGGGATFAQAALRWVLSTGLADSLVVTMRSREDVDEYLGASGWRTAHAADGALLVRYAHASADRQCRYGCNDCAGACPGGQSIPDALRARMYAEDYEDLPLARAAVGAAGLDPEACRSCDGSPCATACPHGLAIPELTRRLAAALAG